MATHAGDPLPFDPGVRGNIRDDFLVAVQTRLLGYFPIPRLDLNGVRKSAGGEGEGMPETVVRLHLFPQKIMRCVAIVAGRYGTVAGLDPGVVVILHDVAVRTCLGIVDRPRSEKSPLSSLNPSRYPLILPLSD